MHNSATGEPRYISDGYELEDFALPVGFAVTICLFFFSRVVSNRYKYTRPCSTNVVLKVAVDAHGSRKTHELKKHCPKQENG